MTEAPRLIAWETTAGCNLSCRHCRGSSNFEKPEGELTTKEALDLIDQIADMGDPILILSGGEPLVREDIFDIAKYATTKGLRVAMATNGTLLTPEIAGKLKDVGIQRVSISLDGSNPKTHNEFRGVPNAFENSLKGIEILKDAGIGFQINPTITKTNIEEIPGI